MNENAEPDLEQTPDNGNSKEDEEMTKLQDLMTIFIAAIREYIENNNDDYADLCEEWLTDGLDQNSSMEDIKRICNIISKADLYMLFKLSPALQEGYDIIKTEHDIQHISKNLQDAKPDVKELEEIDFEFTTALMDSEWSSLHKQAFEIVTEWANTQKRNHLAMAWRSAVRDGLTQDMTWSEAKQLLLSNTYVEYACYLMACPLLESIMKIFVDTDDYLVNYALYDNLHPHTISVENTPIARNHARLQPILTRSAETYLSLPTMLSDDEPDLVDNQQYMFRSEDTPSEKSWEQVTTAADTQTIWEPEHPIENFAFINSMIYKTISKWAADPLNTKHPFYARYQHVKYKGYSHTTPWNTICDIMHIANIGQYIDFVYQCPAVHLEYQPHWDKWENTIRYRWRNPKDMKDLQRETHVVQSTYMYIKSLAFDFDMKIQKMKHMLSDTNTELVRYQTTIDDQIRQGNGKITQHAARSLREIVYTTKEQSQKYTRDLGTKFTEYMTVYQDKIDKLTDTSLNTIQEQCNILEANLKQKLEDICTNAISEIKTLLNKETPGATVQANIPLKPSPRFPNAIIPPARECYNPFDRPPTPPAEEQSDEEWGRHGPSNIRPDNDTPIPLPQLMPFKLVTNVRVPYTGKDSSYTWYYTFCSAVQQYGILLIPVEHFKRDRSLCPKFYYGTKVDPLRYKDMADALYQLLQHTDTVPTEHTKVRNIINRHASNTDGYSALYEIMERIHPRLNPDAKLSPPQSANCSDIHEYYNQLDAYFLHNSFENVQFNPRRQVHIFLEGLDQSYAPAILQIRQVLRTWREDEPPPEDLKLTSLPRTVEYIMQEQTTFPTVRALRHDTRTTPPPKTGKLPNIPKPAPRPFVNIQCSYCKAFGHKRVNCNRMAQFILLMEAYKLLDDKSKRAILENYSISVNERRARRIQRVKGTVQALYTKGYDEEADALWDQCHSYDGHEDQDSDSEASE